MTPVLLSANQSSQEIITNDPQAAADHDWQRIAISVLKVVGGAFLFAGAAAAMGLGMSFIGNWLIDTASLSTFSMSGIIETIGKVAVYAGDSIFYLGKAVFLTVSMPIYVAVWLEIYIDVIIINVFYGSIYW